MYSVTVIPAPPQRQMVAARLSTAAYQSAKSPHAVKNAMLQITLATVSSLSSTLYSWLLSMKIIEVLLTDEETEDQSPKETGNTKQ